ncbi:MAG: hypothetical protein M3137_08600 [Actinomycetota bacterium]|nr:hypothetical protein [Actinomycetota bacterium]
MPSTAAELFAAAGLHPIGAVRWNTTLGETGPGNYIVALTKDAHTLTGTLPDCPLNHGQLGHLLDVRPELRLAGSRPSVDELAALLQAFWMPDEVVLYIGLAGTSLRKRVGQYYRTPLGAKRPHAGGWWLKTLSVLGGVWVHYAPNPENDRAEVAMLQRFSTGLSTTLVTGCRTPPIRPPLRTYARGGAITKPTASLARPASSGTRPCPDPDGLR